MTRPIGIFDSGVGGLTVVRAVRALLPSEPLIYLGDTARVPYGSKSAATVTRYAERCAQALLARDIKLLLVACNTASAHALPVLARGPVPVIGAVLPGAASARAATRNRHVGVIGTLGTVRSGAYEAALRALDPAIQVSTQACPMLVPLAEEGWTDRIAVHIAERYLGELAAADPAIDTLVLGCTHYPLLEEPIRVAARRVFGRELVLVDSARAMASAAAVADMPRATPGARGPLTLLVTDHSRLDDLGERFLGETLPAVELVDI